MTLIGTTEVKLVSLEKSETIIHCLVTSAKDSSLGPEISAVGLTKLSGLSIAIFPVSKERAAIISVSR